MNTPKFKVGEDVILQSISCPHYNGDHLVRAILQDGEPYQCRFSGNIYLTEGGISYVLEELLIDDLDGVTVECLWDESALRKKYPPSTKSFDELMEELKEFEC